MVDLATVDLHYSEDIKAILYYIQHRKNKCIPSKEIMLHHYMDKMKSKPPRIAPPPILTGKSDNTFSICLHYFQCELKKVKGVLSKFRSLEEEDYNDGLNEAIRELYVFPLITNACKFEEDNSRTFSDFCCSTSSQRSLFWNFWHLLDALYFSVRSLTFDDIEEESVDVKRSKEQSQQEHHSQGHDKAKKSPNLHDTVVDLTYSPLPTMRPPSYIDDGLEVVEAPPMRATASNKRPLQELETNTLGAKEWSREKNEGNDEDIECVLLHSTGQNVLEAYPHPRENCVVFPMAEAWNGAANKEHCPMCYCYVCDKPARECSRWTKDHCNARHSSGKWKKRRLDTQRRLTKSK